MQVSSRTVQVSQLKGTIDSGLTCLPAIHFSESLTIYARAAAGQQNSGISRVVKCKSVQVNAGQCKYGASQSIGRYN